MNMRFSVFCFFILASSECPSLFCDLQIVALCRTRVMDFQKQGIKKYLHFGGLTTIDTKKG